MVRSFNRDETELMAREISAVNQELKASGRPYVIIGPGRWGSKGKAGLLLPSDVG